MYRGFRIEGISPGDDDRLPGCSPGKRAYDFFEIRIYQRKFAPDSICNSELIDGSFRRQTSDSSSETGQSDGTATQFNCEQTGVDQSGEPILTRIVTEDSKPPLEIYDISIINGRSPSNQSYVRGIIPVVLISGSSRPAPHRTD